MPTRFNVFSHIEDLDLGSLVFEPAFQQKRGQAWLCRYALHQLQGDEFRPNTAQKGYKRWHAFLPLTPDAQWPEEDLMTVVPSPPPISADAVKTVVSIQVGKSVPIAIALPMAVAEGRKKAFFLADEDHLAGEDAKRSDFLLVPVTSENQKMALPQHLEQARNRLDDACDFSPWGNPFRLEGLKCVGFEIAVSHPGATILVWDPHGEKTAALGLAASTFNHFEKKPPFRIITLQPKPFDAVCQAFEGRQPDWSPFSRPENQSHVPPPLGWLREMTTFLQQSGGTTLAVNSQSAQPGFSEALDILLRTGFVDEEDTLMLWA